MKKKLFLLLLVFTLLGFNIAKVNAEAEVVDKNIEWKELKINNKTYYRAFYNNNGIKISNNFIPLVLIGGNPSFCLEMIEALVKYDQNNNGEYDVNDYYLEDSTGSRNSLVVKSFNDLITTNTSNYLKTVNYNNINYNTQELIELVAYYGKYFYSVETNNDEKNKYYLAAQRLLWKIISDSKIYPADKIYNNEEFVKGDIYIINTNNYQKSETELKNDTSVLLDLSKYENNIFNKINEYYNKPKILDTFEIENYKINDNEKKYFELDHKNNIIKNLTFSNKSECQLKDDKSKIICTDSNEDDVIYLELTFNGTSNQYYKINEGLVERNQMLLLSTSTPSLNYKHEIKIIPIEEETPVENVIIEEPEENPTTSDTNIILVITVCLCTLICVIIMYIRKVKLLKNNTF